MKIVNNFRARFDLISENGDLILRFYLMDVRETAVNVSATFK
jgi:hypothetical protein